MRILSGIVFFYCAVLPGLGCAPPDARSLRPSELDELTTVTLQSGDLKAVLVNNEAFEPVHRAGYNGVAELYHTAQDSNLFVPRFAGFNLEHIFGGDSLEQLFEPRKHAMELYRRDTGEVLLYQPPTPLSRMESLTTFRLEEPHYIDITFRCIFRESDFFRHGYAGIFWASYVDTPGDLKIYFRGVEEGEGTERWIAAYSEGHGDASTHISRSDDYAPFYAPNFNATLASNISDYRYSAPFFFGRFHDMVLAYLFDAPEEVRFSQSPSGGGPVSADSSPAWDFHYLIPDLEFGKEYSFRARLIYKPFVSATDIAEEYEAWKAGLD